MGVLNILKDILVFILLCPVIVLFLPITAFFSIWKFIIFIIVSTFYRKRQMVFLNPIDTYFYGSEGRKDFYTRSSRTIFATSILDGNLSTSELKNHFQKILIHERGKNGKLKFIRLQKRLVKMFGYIFLELDPNFKISNHIRLHEISLDENSVTDYLESQRTAPFLANSPLWEMVIVPNYNHENKTFLVVRVHHVVMDGFSVFAVMKSFCTEGKAPFEYLEHPRTPRRPLSNIQYLKRLYDNTIGLPRKFFLEQSSNGKLLDFAPSEHTFYKVAARIPLKKFKELKANGVAFTEAILTALSYAISETIISRKNADGVRTKLTVAAPVKSEVIGNNVGIVDINLPTVPVDKNDRRQICRDQLRKTRSAVTPKVIGVIMNLANIFPSQIFIKYLANPLDSNCVLISNTPGPTEEIFFLGHPVQDMLYSFGALMNPFICVCIVSYNGIINITLTGTSNIFKTRAEFLAFSGSFEVTLVNLVELKANELLLEINEV